jgi:putative alpha-1,2-mannosidase
VSPFIRSGGFAYGYGGINPGANYPYSVMRLGPDTTSTIADLSYRHFSGYNYMDDKIRGFSHTHLVGAGVNDLGTFGIMPFNVGTLKSDRPEFNGWWSKMDKDSEVASPGYYKVHLVDPNVDAELLAVGTHAAVHRYTYLAKESSHPDYTAGLLFDVCHAAKLEVGSDHPCRNASITFDENNSNIFRASVQFSGGLSGTTWYYFYGEIFPSTGKLAKSHWTTCVDKKALGSCSDTLSASSTSGTLFSLGTFAHLSKDVTNNFSIEVRVGVSHISFDLAQQNLEDAIPTKLTPFSFLKQRTEETWCGHLRDLQVETQAGDEELETILASSFYRTFIGITDYTEHGGVYLGLDGKVHNVSAERSSYMTASESSSLYGNRFFSDLSLWDTFRTLQPWLLLTNEDLAIGVARSMVDITVQQQSFPRWTLVNHEASCMIGESGAWFLLEAALSGFQELTVRAKDIQLAIYPTLAHQWTNRCRALYDRRICFSGNRRFRHKYYFNLCL